jgi:hypothetical protein
MRTVDKMTEDHVVLPKLVVLPMINIHERVILDKRQAIVTELKEKWKDLQQESKKSLAMIKSGEAKIRAVESTIASYIAVFTLILPR